MYSVPPLCTSYCTSCGVLCESFPIRDIPSAQLYLTKKCTVIVGDLYITNLPAPITRKVLAQYLGNIQYIRGTLHVRDNMFRTGMNFFSNLLGVNGITYFNNPLMTDARMLSLKTLSGNVTVEGCPRLCPARYTRVGPGPDDSYCTNTNLNHFFQVVGDVENVHLTTLGSIVARAARNVTGNQV